MRDRWEKFANEHLAAYGLDVRIEVRWLQGQGIDRVPTTHLGVAVWAMERRGVETRVGLRVPEQQAQAARRSATTRGAPKVRTQLPAQASVSRGAGKLTHPRRAIQARSAANPAPGSYRR